MFVNHIPNVSGVNMVQQKTPRKRIRRYSGLVTGVGGYSRLVRR